MPTMHWDRNETGCDAGPWTRPDTWPNQQNGIHANGFDKRCHTMSRRHCLILGTVSSSSLLFCGRTRSILARHSATWVELFVNTVLISSDTIAYHLSQVKVWQDLHINFSIRWVTWLYTHGHRSPAILWSKYCLFWQWNRSGLFPLCRPLTDAFPERSRRVSLFRLPAVMMAAWAVVPRPSAILLSAFSRVFLVLLWRIMTL